MCSCRISRSLTQRIRLEQDAAYLESLRQDQEKDRRKQEEEERRMSAIREEQERERAEQEKRDVSPCKLLGYMPKFDLEFYFGRG